MKASDLLPSQLVAFDERTDPQLEAATELEDVARHLDLEAWIVQRLLHPERELITNLIVNRATGAPAIFTGYRVQHLTSRGPTLGGVSFSPRAYLAGVRAAAMQATWQAALLNLPFGGAAGAIVCNPDELSEDELRQLSKDYAHALRGIVGRFEDVLAPGLGCHTQMIAWMLDAISHDSGRVEPGVAAGKPENMYGLPDYTGTTTQGIVLLLDWLVENPIARRLSLPLQKNGISGLRISMQGFGSLGASLARALYDQGARIVALADISGGLRNDDGIDIPALQKHTVDKSLIFGFDGADNVRNADVLEADCDVLITAAAERQITGTNAERIGAPVVIEAAKWAVTGTAEQTLAAKGKIVVPEILASAGAAIAAFLEWNQSARYSSVTAAEMQSELAKRLTSVASTVISSAEKNETTLRRAANLVAIDRVASEMRMRR